MNKLITIAKWMLGIVGAFFTTIIIIISFAATSVSLSDTIDVEVKVDGETMKKAINIEDGLHIQVNDDGFLINGVDVSE